MWRLDLRGRRSAAVCAGTGQPGVHCPPYNVDYEGYTEEKLKIKSDSMPAEEFNAFLLPAFAPCRTETGSGSLEIKGRGRGIRKRYRQLNMVAANFCGTR